MDTSSAAAGDQDKTQVAGMATPFGASGGEPEGGARRSRGVRDGIRASDAEREDALRNLARHYADGRLDQAEFDARADEAFAARTREQLRTLFRDLPQPAADVAQASERPQRTARTGLPSRVRAQPVLLLVPLLFALAIVASLHGVPLFPLIPLFFILTRRQRRWHREARPWI